MTTAFTFKSPEFVLDEIRKERLRRLLLSDLVEFSKYFFEARGDKFLVNHHHEKIRDALDDVRCGKIKNLLINMPPRYGKAIDSETPMLTKSGWKKASEVIVGDKLVGSSGHWVSVVGVFQQGIKESFKLSFTDGQSIRCCSEHFWQVQQRYCGGPRVKTTAELIGDLHESDKRKKWKIPMVSPIVGTKKDLLIDPYLFGCWLGDGSTSSAEICTMDEQIYNAFCEKYELTLRKHQSSGRAKSYGILGLHTQLKQLGVFGKKFIPKEYLEADFESRLALLQGLNDTDGTCGKNNQISFSNCNRDIIDGFEFLVCSLGGVFREYKRPMRSENHSQSWNINFRLPYGVSPFRLKRKMDHCKPVNSKTAPRRFIDSIVPDGTAEMVCFSVDAEDRLFAAGNGLILTHNTEEAVVNFIAQSIAENPKAKFIHLSYSDELALENSSKARELIRSDKYQELWPVQLKEDADSKKKWYTMEGGGLYATSSGGPITGFGAGATKEDTDEGFYGAIIIDDPMKVDDAESKGERDFINERLNTTIKSRRNSRRTPIIIIMQRLHEEDMSGFVLNGGMGEKFHHLKLAAIQPDGTPLWPVKHTIEELEAERNADPFTFSGQMMQEPSPEDGTFFKKEWFKRFELGEQPDNLTMYGASDYAVTEGGGDFTEQGVGGFDEKEDLWFVDWWSGQTTPDKWIEEEFRLVRRHDPLAWVAEGGMIRRSVEPFIKKEQNVKGCYFRLEWVNSNKSKTANARAIQALASQGKVHIPKTPWGDALIHQLLQFPVGKYDDKVDVLGLFGRMLDQTFGPRAIAPIVAVPRDAWDWSEESDSNSWKVN